MKASQPFEQGGYNFVPGVFQYSAGVSAMPGHQIVRVRFRRPIAFAEGFAKIRQWIEAAGRPLTAFCACELRSPAPFTETGFAEFNKMYVDELSHWGLFDGQTNPVARSNLCPASNPPREPSFHAFSYTELCDDADPSFIVSGSGEAPEGKGNYRDNAISLGDTSPKGLLAKAVFVLEEMERRLAKLGFGWEDTSAVQVYCVHDIHPIFADEIIRRGAGRDGVTWHFDRPPVMDLEFEMDCRSVAIERMI